MKLVVGLLVFVLMLTAITEPRYLMSLYPLLLLAAAKSKGLGAAKPIKDLKRPVAYGAQPLARPTP